ncbi:MAG: Crp/Fnr family transcriptional regulator [Paralcaligenes sp.]
MATTPDPSQNHLLAALPAEELACLAPDLELVALRLGQTVSEPDIPTSNAYFPTTAIISLVYNTEDGASTEVATIGNEGTVGVCIFTGGESTKNHAIVQNAGYAYRIKRQVLKDAFFRAAPLRRLLLHYTQALISQTAQSAVCNRHHSVDQQLCRWLLLSMDRLSTNQLTMTQERIANMLSVRRPSVTEAAWKLQHRGLIRYNRGKITVLDRAGLEARVCECYSTVKKEFDRLLLEHAI